MINKRIWLGILPMVVVLVFGMTVIGCEVEENYTVTFDLDGGIYNGNAASVQKTVKSGETIEILPYPSKEGYDFSGWFTEKNGGGTRFTAEVKVTSDLIVYAKWTVKANTEPKSIIITDFARKGGSAFTGNVIIKISKFEYAISTVAMSEKVAITGKTLNIPLKKGNTEWVLVGAEIIDWTGNGSYIIQLETVGQGIWNYTNGKTWAELGITTSTPYNDFFKKLPEYDFKDKVSTIQFSQFQDQTTISP
jgi:uncharacterized repeat protein (TIGR02543 family)